MYIWLHNSFPRWNENLIPGLWWTSRPVMASTSPAAPLWTRQTRRRVTVEVRPSRGESISTTAPSPWGVRLRCRHLLPFRPSLCSSHFYFFFFCFFWLRKLSEYYFLAQAFRAGLRKLGPKNNIPEVFLTKKAKKMNHGSPLFPTFISRKLFTDGLRDC